MDKKILHTFPLKFLGAIKEPREELRIKIFCGSIRVQVGPTWLFHDCWYIVGDYNEVVSDFVTKRYTEYMDPNFIHHKVLGRIQENVYENFVQKYPDGVIIHVMGLYQLRPYEHILDYKTFPDGKVI